MQRHIELLEKELFKVVLKQGGNLKDAFNFGKYKNFSTISREENDLENKIDIETDIENEICETARRIIPDIGLITEESELRETDKIITCQVDPIDGTKYFVRGVPLFSISVGIEDKGEPILGMVYAPVLNQFYIGGIHKPTELNGRRVHVSQESELIKSFISVDMATRKANWDKEKDWMFKKVIELTNAVQRTRMLGIGAMSLAWVASGGLNGYISLWGHLSKPFDVSGGKALVKFAGGEIRNVVVPGIEQPRLIAGNMQIVDQLEAILLNH